MRCKIGGREEERERLVAGRKERYSDIQFDRNEGNRQSKSDRIPTGKIEYRRRGKMAARKRGRVKRRIEKRGT